MTQFPTPFFGAPIIGGVGIPWNPVVQDDVQTVAAKVVKPTDPVKRYNYGGVGSGVLGGYPGFGPLGQCGLSVTRMSSTFAWLLRSDPVLAHVFSTVCGPIITAGRSIVVDDLGAGPDQCEKVRVAASADLIPMLNRAMPGAIESPNFGYWTQELVWDHNDGRTAPVDLLPVLPGEGELHADPHRRLTGVKFGQEFRDARYFFHCVHQPHIDRVLGWSNNQAALNAWFRSVKSAENTDATERKVSGVQLLLYIAEGAVPIDPNTNLPMSPVELGQRWLAKAARGESLVLPKWAFPKDEIERNPALADVPAITHELLDFGNLGPAIEASLKRIERCDTEKWFAWGVSARALTESSSGVGGAADAAAHTSSVTPISGRIHASIVDQWDAQVTTPWKRANYGDAKLRVRTVPAPLVDDKRQFLEGMATTLATNPTASVRFTANLDERKLLDQLGAPMLSPEDAAKKQADAEQKQADAAKAKTDAMNAGKQDQPAKSEPAPK